VAAHSPGLVALRNLGKPAISINDVPARIKVEK
jgi:hypothetical protein